MKKNPFFGSLFLFLLIVTVLSCQKESRPPLADETAGASIKKGSFEWDDATTKMLGSNLLKSVRNATARFHSTTQAIKAGYAESHDCVYDEINGTGGMGYHWVNFDLVDPVFDPTKPEVLLYAPGPGGNLRLVAVEYIVVDVGQPAPTFGSQPFDVGGTPLPFDHWSLHVWLYEPNPAGMFTRFNPNIRCP